jgi:hypothetical protein
VIVKFFANDAHKVCSTISLLQAEYNHKEWNMPEEKQHNAKAQFVAEHKRAFPLIIAFAGGRFTPIVKQRE